MRTYTYDGRPPRARFKFPMTGNRAAVLDFIKGELAAGRAFPSVRRIAVRMRWRSDTSARDALAGLVIDGKLVRRQEDGRQKWELAP